MRVLVLGAAGMLGHKLCQVLGESSDVYGTFRSAMPAVRGVYERTTPILGIDVTKEISLEQAIAVARPDVIINAIGIVKQLASAKDPIASIHLNSLLPHILMRIGNDRGFKVVHISTDCVFSGRKGHYDENDIPDPVDLYGRSKLLGEIGAPGLTLRTSIIGRELRTQNGLVEWFLSQRGGRVNGFANAIYSGLTTLALASVIGRLITGELPLDGLWQVSSSPISKYELLLKLNAAFGTRTEIHRDETFVCDRSLDSARFRATAGLVPPSWDDMVSAMAADPTPYRAGGK